MNILTTRKNVSIAHHHLTEAAALTAPRRSTAMAAAQTNVDGVEALLLEADAHIALQRSTRSSRWRIFAASFIHDNCHYQECDFSSVTLPVQDLSARSAY
jgi:hypothetical protein